MAKFPLKKYGYLVSAKKVLSLINELKNKNVKLTAELKARIVGKIQGKEALNFWREHFCELDTPELESKPEPSKKYIKDINTSSVHKSKKRNKWKWRKNNVVENGPQVDPNSSNYETDLLKENLKSKYKDYDYGLSDW